MSKREVDRAHDWQLDWCCFRTVEPDHKPDVKITEELLEEVCLRCGHYYTGNLDHCYNERTTHVCDPSKRKPIPKWALVNRKHDRSKR